MPIYSFLRSPIFLTGAGTVFSGTIGIGGWQIYEETFPTNHKKFSKLGYKWDPIVPPNEKKEQDVRWTWNSWGCVTRLFPGVEFKHNSASSQTSTTYPPAQENDLTLNQESNPIGCAIMELQPVEHQNKTYFYFKSEFVIKGKDVGWVLGTGFSQVPEKENNSSGAQYTSDLKSIYRLLFLKKKQDGNGEIKEGYIWENFSATTPTQNKYFVKSPEKVGFNGRLHTETSDFSDEKGSGIWEIDVGAKEGPLKGIEVYIDDPKYAEILGDDGEFSEAKDGVGGFETVTTAYDPSQGWVSGSYSGVNNRFIKWYAPFKQLKGKGTDLKSRCSSLSNSRDSNSHNLNELKDLCGNLDVKK